MAEIKFSPESLRDLREISEYISQELENPLAADNTIRKIIERINTLSDFPNIGNPISSVINIETNYRYLVCENYLSFYRVENDTVYIVRVLYGGRNYIEILFGKQE